MNAFETLGIKPGASEKEIKKAYFAAVRRHPPDKEPERFKQIRAAYDELRDGERRQTAETTADMPPAAREALDAASAALKRKDAVQALHILTDALAHTQESPLIMLTGDLYMTEGKFGLAVKHFEKYCIQFPKKPVFAASLAVAYWQRGWNKKAKAQFLYVILHGYMVPDFLEDFADFCEDEDDPALLESVLTKVLERLPDQEGASSAAVCLARLCTFAGFGAERVRAYLAGRSAFVTEAFFVELIEQLADEVDTEDYALARSIPDLAVELAPGLTGNFTFGKTRYLMEFRLMTESMGVSPTDGEKGLAMYAAAVFDREFEGRSSYLEYYEPKATYSVFDAQMTLISVFRKSRPNLRMVIERYPYIWSFLEDFITKLQSATNLNKFSDRFAINFIKSATPDLQTVLRERVPKDVYAYYQAMIDAPAPVRSSKIQPNAPCPCGSGKKYKKCCGARA